MICQLTALRYEHVQDIAESLVPKNSVQVFREENPKDSSGVAYKIICKGVCIGYMPDLKTLRKYYSDTTTMAEQTRIREWGRADKAIRTQYGIDYDQSGTEQWVGRITTLLYATDANWTPNKIVAIEWQEYSDLCQAGKAEGYKLRQVSVLFDGVECF